MRAVEPTDNQLAEMFHLMGDTSRLKSSAACPSMPMRGSYIAARYGLSQSLVSRHVQLLRTARVLQSIRRGKQIFYAAGDEHVKRAITDMADRDREHCAADLQA